MTMVAAAPPLTMVWLMMSKFTESRLMNTTTL